MDRATLLKTLVEIVERSVGEDIVGIEESKNLKDDLGLDSIDFVSMAIEVQSTFNIELKTDELTGLVQVKDLLDLIQKKLADRDEAGATPGAAQGDKSAGESRAA